MTRPNERPHPNTYWVEPGRLLAGEYPGALAEDEARSKLRRFLQAGLSVFLDLTEAHELNPYAHLLQEEAVALGLHAEHHRMPIRDGDVPHARQAMTDILDVIDQALAAGRGVYVHCWGGIGRTGTVVGCYLVRHGRSGEQALAELAERWKTVAKAARRPHSPETAEQRQWVLTWMEPSKEAAMITLRDCYRGALLGLAAGDALGTTLEFTTPGRFTPLDDMVGGGPFRLAPGQWTDDTSMALCLAKSLVETAGFDARDQMERYVRWWKEGYLSSTGRCFDIGNTVRAALQRFLTTGDPYAGSTHPYAAGNGSLMRLAPVPLFYADRPEEALQRAADSSRTTHTTPAAVDACRYFAGLLVGALRGAAKDELLSERYAPMPGYWERHPLDASIDAVARGSFKEKDPPAIRGSGYVVHSLEAALWAFYRSSDFRSGCLLAVNLGEDADTTGAIYGQLAGAYYGVEGIPASWRDCLTMRSVIEALADRLMPPHFQGHGT